MVSAVIRSPAKGSPPCGGGYQGGRLYAASSLDESIGDAVVICRAGFLGVTGPSPRPQPFASRSDEGGPASTDMSSPTTLRPCTKVTAISAAVRRQRPTPAAPTSSAASLPPSLGGYHPVGLFTSPGARLRGLGLKEPT